jgi:hypothetical protein
VHRVSALASPQHPSPAAGELLTAQGSSPATADRAPSETPARTASASKAPAIRRVVNIVR